MHLNSTFTSVFTRENTKYISTLDKVFNGAPLQDLSITQQMVENKLSKLKTNKSSGPDGFHSRVLKETESSIGLPLSILYNMSLTEGHVPHIWKGGNITPIYKKSSKADTGNYRPVSLTSVLGKVMESFIRDHLVDHMTKHTIFCESQHGFVPGRPCITQLLITLELWTELLDSGVSLDCIYLDFKKAVDSVPHQRLLSKLDAYSIGGPLTTWTKYFLLDRKQRVVVNGKLSSFSLVLSGIPQKSECTWSNPICHFHK